MMLINLTVFKNCQAKKLIVNFLPTALRQAFWSGFVDDSAICFRSYTNLRERKNAHF